MSVIQFDLFPSNVEPTSITFDLKLLDGGWHFINLIGTGTKLFHFNSLLDLKIIFIIIKMSGTGKWTIKN